MDKLKKGKLSRGCLQQQQQQNNMLYIIKALDSETFWLGTKVRPYVG